MPSPAVSDFDYAALFYKDGEFPENEKFEPGTKATDSENLIFSFQKPDDTGGEFTLEIFAFAKGMNAADEETPQFSRENALLFGTKTGLTIAGDAINVTDPIALAISSAKPGTVSLKIKVPEGCSLEIDETAKTNFDCKKDEASSDTYTLTQKDENGIPAGAYQVTFTVKKGTEIVNVFSEYINVLNGLCTDTWNGLAKDEAKEITQGMISSMVYVRGTGGWYDNSDYNTTATASDENLGSFLSPLATIQKAVNKIIAINDGTSAYTIFVDGTLDGTTVEHLSANGMADFSRLTKNLKLTIKALSGTATLDANQKSRVINAAPASGTLALTLVNLVIKGGNTTGNGGGIYTTGTLEMEGCTISGNTAGVKGGGIYIEGGTVKMKDCTITDCKAGGTSDGDGGGIYNASGTLELTGVTITLEGDGTRAADRGGGIFNAGTLTMTGGSITGGGRLSSNVFQGGGIYNTGALTIEGVTISNFYATSRGGGIYKINGETAADFATIKDCIITNCGSAQSGSGICTYEGKLKLENVDIIGGTAGKSSGIYCDTSELTIIGGKIDGFEGSGIYTNSNSKLKMDGTTVSGNTSQDSGVGVGVYCPFEIKNCTITGNTAKNWSNFQEGGGLYISNCTGTITNTTISGNTAVRDGGGVYIKGTADVTITGCIIKNNTATKGDGGGIYIKDNTATLKMNGGEISGNTAGGDGGGVCVYGGTFTMEDGEISGNEATKNGGGVYDGGTFTMSGGTVSGNTPDDVYPTP